jgi:pimeloyl-ACP methyl ester carboxylesterase
MARGDPDPQRCRPDSEPQRRAEVHRLAVDPGVHRCRGIHLQPRRGPGSPWRVRAVAGCVEDDDAELAAVHSRTGSSDQRAISRAFVDGQPSGGLTRDHILDNITTYWLTGTGASAARSYWEGGRAQALAAAAGQAPPEVKLPVGFTVFPGEIFRAPRSWAEKAYPNLTYFNEVDKGGHFAAWEEPELFATEIRAAFRSLR